MIHWIFCINELPAKTIFLPKKFIKSQGWENYINFVIHNFVGINFDFNKLQAAEGHYYNVTNGDYDYILNLCGPVKNTLCDQKASPVTNPGVCQVKHGGTAA